MTQHIVCRIGPTDDFAPSTTDGASVSTFAINGATNGPAVPNSISHEIRRTSSRPSQTAFDLLHLAMAVYSADLCTHRSGGFNSWTRHFRLHVAVEQPSLWSRLTDTLTEMLGFLSGDHWEIDFRELRPDAVVQLKATEKTEFPDAPTAVSLFSGGLDSFIGSIERLEAGERLVLVGHHGKGTTNQAQQRVSAVIANHHPDKAAWLHFYVQQPTLGSSDFEKTTRSRSLLFLALGTAVAAGYQPSVPLYVPENGLISLNPPLTSSRMGSLSTRTTHPHFMSLFRNVVDRLGIAVAVETPYRFQTKGEMANRLRNNAAFLAGVHETVSCSHPDVGRYQGNSPGQHCGYCVPCIIRRAALATAGLDDPKRYLMDILAKRPPNGSDTARDLRAFEMAVSRFASSPKARDLFEVLSTGPIPPESAAQYAGVYRRGMNEVKTFLSGGSKKP